MADYRDSVIQLIQEYSCERIAEVGVLRGHLTKAVLAACQLQAYCLQAYYLIDPWRAYEGFGAGMLADITNWEDICLRVHSDFWKYNEVRIIRLESVRAATLFEPDSLDLVFINAVHEEESVAEDIEAWLPKTRIIAGHDYSSRWPGVMRAVDSALPKRKLKEGNVWYKIR